MEKNDALRKKFDLIVEYQRRNKEYEEYCKSIRTECKSKSTKITFDDPFTMTNEVLWERHNQFKGSGVGRADFPTLIWSSELVLRFWLKREPTTKELIEYLKSHFEKISYIVFDPNMSITALTKGFREMVEEARAKRDKETSSDKDCFSAYRNDELERYLAVYDARETIVNGKKMKWASVCKLLFPKKEFSEEDRQSLLRDYRKASELIRKVCP